VSKADEFLASKKVEVNSLQDQISEKDCFILELEAKISDLDGKFSTISSSAEDEAKMLSARIDKMANDNEELRTKKRQLESSMRKLENEMDSMSSSNSELTVRIVEKETQYKQVRSQVESMRVTYEKHQRELNERLERSVQDNSVVDDLQKALDGERLRMDELQVQDLIL
jgi:chromosome segregation ATPase